MTAGPGPVDPLAVGAPLPTTEELAAWRVVVERLDHGDDSVAVPWLEVLRDLGLAPAPI